MKVDEVGIEAIGVEPDDGDTWASLFELTRDLAEVFKREVGGHPQFSELLGRIECVEIEPGEAGIVTLDRLWSV